MAMTTRSKGGSPTFGGSSPGSDSSDDSKDKFLIAYTRRKTKSEGETKTEGQESESARVAEKTKKAAPKKRAPRKKVVAKKESENNESESKSESKDMSEVGSEKGDHESSSSGSSSSSSSSSSSNRSTPNQELENAAKDEDANNDNKSESGDSKSESGESSSDSKSESGDSKSESGDSKSESGESVDHEEEKTEKEPSVAMETEKKSEETTGKSVEDNASPTKEEESTPKAKTTPKPSPTKGNNPDDKSPNEREYIIRTRTGRGQSSPPSTPTELQPPVTPVSETKKSSPKISVPRQTSLEAKPGPRASLSPGIKGGKKKTPVKTPTKSIEASSVSSADFHGNSSNDSSSTGSIWRRRQGTPTTTDVTEYSEGHQLIEEGRRRLTVSNSDGQKTEKDYFCWVCHKEGPLLMWVACQLCPRIYHVKCLNVETVSDTDWVCSECERVLRAECTDTQSKAMSMLSIDQLCVTLKFALTRMKHSSSEPFLRPVDTLQVPNYLDFIFNPMDLGTLEKNIKKKMYGSTEAFLADAKWILHNCIVFNGLHHKLTSGAKTIVKICRHEMSEIEVCPDCYMNAAYARNENWFCDPCRFPHTLVWAKLKGYPFWPAKALREENGHVDCRFFGAHDRAWVQVSQVYLLSKDIPTQMKKSKAGFEESLEELELHIKKLKEKFGDFHYFPPKTLYKDLEAFAALSPKKDVKISPEKFGSKDDSDSKPTTTTPSPSKLSRYAGANVFTNMTRELENKGPFGTIPRLDKVGKSSNAKEGVFTISDSALAEAVPLTLPTLNKTFAAKAKLPDKNMLDKIMKKLQSDDDEHSDGEEKKELPMTTQGTPEKMDTNTQEKESVTPTTSGQSLEEEKEGKDEKESEGGDEEMEMDAEPTVSTPLPQNLKPNPFLESLVNSCKKKLGVDSVKDLKELSSDDSGDDDDDTSSSSSDDDADSDDGKSVVSGNDADVDEEEDENNDAENDDRHDDNDVAKKESSTVSDEDNPEKKAKTASKGESSKKGGAKNEEGAKEKENGIVDGTNGTLENETADDTEAKQPNKEVDGEVQKMSSDDKPTENGESSQTSKAVDDATKNSESILMQFLISSTTGQGQKRQNDESSASAAKKLRPSSPSANLPSSAAAAGPVSSGCHDNKDGGLSHNTAAFGFNADKYFQKAMSGLKDVFNEMASDILTQGANSVVTRHLQREIEQMKWKHEQECQELRHNAELTLAEMRMSWELERDRAVKEVRQQCTKVKDKAIEDAKKRQWCAQCGKEAMFYCCWNTSYCDYPCQQRHWPLHMNYCTQTQGNQSQDGTTSQSQPNNQSQDPATTKSASATTLSAQALTEQVQRAIQSTNAGVPTKKPWQDFATFDSISSLLSLPQFLPSMRVPSIAPPMLSSIYGNLGPSDQTQPSSPIQITPGKFKTVPQVAVTIAGPQKNMVYAVQMPTGQSVSLSPVVQPTSANSLIKNTGNISFPAPKQ